MLSHAELMSLERGLRDKQVLSIYVNGEFADVAARSQWRTELRNALDAIDESLRDATHAEREAFVAARKLALSELDQYKNGDDAPGWMGLFTGNETHHAAVIHAPVSTSATWSQGANVAPAVRALKESRPVLVVVTDSTNARIYRYVDHRIQLEDTIDRVAKVDQPDHLNRPLPQGFNSGLRGLPGADAAQKELRNATDLMLAEAATRISQLAGDDAWVLIGGIDVVASSLLGRLEKRLTTKSAAAPFDVHDNESRLAALARENVSRLRSAEDLKSVEEILSANAAGGTGAVGLRQIDEALLNGQVHALYVTTKFVSEHAEEAESAIRRAFDESALVEHVSGEAAERLDAAGGIAARLRFVIKPVEAVERDAGAGKQRSSEAVRGA
jgi:hypothetical protein